MMEHILRAQAQTLHDQLDDHDTGDFMHRLAVRIAREASRTTQDPDPIPREGPAAPANELNAPQPGPRRPPAPSALSRLPRRRSTRRSSASLAASGQTTSSSWVIEHIRELCEAVLRSDDVNTLNDFADDYDQVGARTFACLLYTLGRHDSALYWWRFAAGAGDPLAAHLLAAHHAAAGHNPDARLWRTFARMLGFAGHHLPQPVRARTDIADHFARTVPGNPQQRRFMQSARLPCELIAQ